MPNLLIKPNTSIARQFHIRPDNVCERCPDWRYVGFDIIKLETSQSYNDATHDTEHLVVVITGRAQITVSGESKVYNVGKRSTIWEREKAESLYIPPGRSWEIKATQPVEVGVCVAPASKGAYPVRHITGSNQPLEARGKGTNTRYVNAIMMEESQWAESLLVTEVWTPQGNWSSYPAHKHDKDNYPHETYLEETYYHRINPSDGYGFQRVYNDDLSLNETMAVYDGDVVLVPEGYHPAGTPYGYDMYYLNVMAGPVRKWRFQNDPHQEWLFRRDGGKKPGE